MNRKLLCAAIIFPLLVIAGWVGKLTTERRLGVQVELAISGYDPRDLLSGHYLTYRVDYADAPVCTPEDGGQMRCLCLEKSESGLHRGRALERCEAIKCDTYLEGRCQGNRFEAGIERYYFGEAHLETLAVVPAKATILVSVTRDGQGSVEAMKVEGLPLAEWLASRPKKN